MKVTLLTKEYPPNIYGGAGVHVKYLTKYLAELLEVEVRAFGNAVHPGEGALSTRAFQEWSDLGGEKYAQALRTFSTDLALNAVPMVTDAVHCHTWYTFWAGVLAKQLFRVPLVVTMHSLEPLRSWKTEQLGNGYVLSQWAEQYGVEQADRVIAVSESMCADIESCYPGTSDKITVIHNGIDLREYCPCRENKFLKQREIGNKYLLFVGRISRQKGIFALLEAFRLMNDPDLQLVLCAASPDTPELEKELKTAIGSDKRIIWLREMVSAAVLRQLYSHADVFVCPSLYEPFGITNLEAMACGAPIVASRTGGIPEVVIDGECGLLVAPGNIAELVRALQRILNEDALRERFRRNGRERVERCFGWERIARETARVYEEIKE